MAATTTSKLRLLKSRPLCIVCAKPQEAAVIASTLGISEDRISGYDIPEINEGHVFYLGTFSVGSGTAKRNLEYYVASSLRQGIQAFATHVGVLFHVLRPPFAVHAGVCAGYGAKGIELKDVIFGDAAINYEEGKWVVEDGRKIFRPEYSKVGKAIGNISSFAQMKTQRTYKYGTYISGSAVREDAEEMFKLLSTTVDRNIRALDMEASAFLMLCEYLHIGCLGVVKGVSDLGDSSKGEDPDVYDEALAETAEAVRKWTTYHLATHEWKANEEFEAGAHIVKGYYDNFVRVVLDAVGAGNHITVRNQPGAQILSRDIKGIMIVMPDNDDPNLYGEQGHIARITQHAGVAEVIVGSGNAHRSMYYKGGYLIDFPRVLNSLTHGNDGIHQTQVFKRVLKETPYFKTHSASRNALAVVYSCQEFDKFLEEHPGPAKFHEESLLLE